MPSLRSRASNSDPGLVVLRELVVIAFKVGEIVEPLSMDWVDPSLPC